MTSILAARRPSSPGLPPEGEDGQGDGGGGGGSDWVRLATAANDIEAHLLVGRLVEAGIEIHTIKDRSGPGAWLIGGSNPWAPVHVMVRRMSLEDARLVLAELAWASPAASPEAPQESRPAALWWTTALALGLLFTALILVQLIAATSTEPAETRQEFQEGGP